MLKDAAADGLAKRESEKHIEIAQVSFKNRVFFKKNSNF